MVITSNVMAMNAERMFGITSKNLNKRSERLSSGYKINRAADDAAGLSISEKMRWMIRGLDQGTKNTVDGISWCQIGDGAMGEIDDMLHRINELAVKGANGTLTDTDRQMIDAEIQQLKKQINMIGKNTTFNEIPIFDNSYVCLDVQGSVDTIQFFDASYDDQTGEFSFGGVIFNGERITWDKINPDMVSIDPDTGKQVLKEGIYSYTDAKGNSFSFTISGPDTTDITFKKEISADANGLYIDGEFFAWEKVLDEDGNAASPSNYHSGGWGFDYHGAVFSFYMPEGVESFDDFINAIVEANNVKAHYVWEIKQVGQKSEQAVDVTVDRIRISEAFAGDIDKNDYSITVRADEDKIWLEDSDGNTLVGSERTWEDMGINSWEEGSDISGAITYAYYTDDMQDDPYFSFDFTLSDVTSIDSVIDGLDGIVLSKRNFVTNYEIDIDIDEAIDSNILSVGTRANQMMTFERERAFGRNFDDKEVDDVASGTVINNEIVFSDGTILSCKVVQASLESAQNKFEEDLLKYWDYITKIKQSYLLAGKDPDEAFKSAIDLRDIVGKDNITTAGYLDELLAFDRNSLDSYTKGDPGVDGHTYPTAFIDFKNITDASVLNGAGFDSTCKTCNNHYSIMFEGDISAYGNIQTTASGYRYSIEHDGNDYYLRIDTSSLAGLDGAGIAAAIVEITDACFDFHFTQYASEGSKLYIYDNRESSEGAPNASFYTKPYSNISQDTFTIQTRSDEGDYLDLTYTYDFADFADRVTMAMKVDNDNGEYIKVRNNDDGSEYYKLASDPLSDSESQVDTNKYTIAYLYTDSDGNEITITDPEEAKEAARETTIKDYAENALESMLAATTVAFNAKDYTYMNVYGNEKPNAAIRAEFESHLREIETDNGINIKHSGISGDLTTIPRFALNTVVMGIYAAGSKTIEQAEKTINYAKEALSYIAEKRTLYGAYQNRLEHTYNNNMNKSENTTAAESRIRDADIATEIMEHTKESILQQTGVSMLTQANQKPQYALQLLNS